MKMKRILRFIFAGVLVSALCAWFNDLSAQTAKWDYPVKPGTPQWAAFTTKKEKVDACQIPDGVLNSLTTKELVEICLNYPLFSDIIFYDNYQTGFRTVSHYFNGMQELFRRKDNVQPLLDRLRDDDMLKLSSKVKVLSLLEIGRSVREHVNIELLLSHESVISNASAEQQQEIARLSMMNMDIKEYEHQYYGQSSIESSVYLLCASLTAMNGGNSLSHDLEAFMKNGSVQNIAFITNALRQKYIKF